MRKQIGGLRSMISVLKRSKELFSPKLKCERVGHRPEEIDRRIRTGMNDYRQRVLVCRWCDIIIREISREHLTKWHSVTIPSHYWDEIDKKGYIVMQGQGKYE